MCLTVFFLLLHSTVIVFSLRDVLISALRALNKFIIVVLEFLSYFSFGLHYSRAPGIGLLASGRGLFSLLMLVFLHWCLGI